MSEPPSASPPRAARAATFAFFGLNGCVMGTWAAHISVIARRTDAGPGRLGWLLLILGGAAFVGMRLAGPLTDRLGAHRTVPAAAVLCGSALILPALVHSMWTLGAALAVFGFGNGCLDVAMNTHAVHVERAYGRPVMAAFHAVWSLGGVLAAAFAAGALALGWPITATFTAVAGLAAAITTVASRFLLHTGPESREAAGAEEQPAGSGRRTSRRIWALALMAFAVMLCEGVAYDWSTVHVRTVLGAPATTAALAYGAFATAATIGRLTVDRVAARFGPVAVVRYGAAVAGIGMLVAAVAQQVPTAIAGWILVGVGLSGCVPQLFSAAGSVDPAASGAHVARVAGLGYLGMLAGPAVIGGLSHVVALNTAFVAPALLCLLAAGSAGALRSPATRPASRRPGSPAPAPGPAR